jgi:ATPase family associated with various cellular activities (AAA)
MVASTTTIRPFRALSFSSALDHLQAELRLVDLLVLRGLRGVEGRLRSGLGFHGVPVSVEEMYGLLEPDPTGPVDGAVGETLDSEVSSLRAAIDAAVARGSDEGVALPLAQLAGRFALTGFETQTIVVCLAPELDSKYERLYSYLQGDLARRDPSADLVTRLLCRDPFDRWGALASFSPNSSLLRYGILRPGNDPHGPSGGSSLVRPLQVDPHIVSYLLGDYRLDVRANGTARPLDAREHWGPDDHGGVIQGLHSLVRHHFSSRPVPLIVYLRGPYGAGQEDIALGLAARLERPLICLDGELAPTDGLELGAVLEAVFRDAYLWAAPVLVLGADRLIPGDGEDRVRLLASILNKYPGVTLVAGERSWPRFARHSSIAVHVIRLTVPDLARRHAAWSSVLPTEQAELSAELANQFRLTVGQIRDAVAEVGRSCAVQSTDGPTATDWFAACRGQSSHSLAELGQKQTGHHGWDDLVLDQKRVGQLQDMCVQVRYRERVFSEWGLGRKVTSGRGITALFTGPPGTGKTLAATVISYELGLDLYRIDLSQVVSKYIGETEKNLARIFAEAETSNAVLLFDEADALFGKRTEIRDAHDRYANIETSYLLQRMEEYEGIAILASNLRQNMDEAFVRRLRVIVEFPFPDAASRLRIWSGHLATGAPLAEDIDLRLLAESLPISGGGIRNVVLSAAFLAAARGEPIGMRHLVGAAKAEFEKTGKLWIDLPIEAKGEVA